MPCSQSYNKRKVKQNRDSRPAPKDRSAFRLKALGQPAHKKFESYTALILALCNVLFQHAFIMAANIFTQRGFSYKTCAIRKPYGRAAPILPSISNNNFYYFVFAIFLPSWFLTAS